MAVFTVGKNARLGGCDGKRLQCAMDSPGWREWLKAVGGLNNRVGVSRLAVCAVGSLRGSRFARLHGWRFARLAAARLTFCAVGEYMRGCFAQLAVGGLHS